MSYGGILRTFRRRRGFGFIERDDGQGDLYCHVSHFTNAEPDDVIVGSKLTFDILVDEQRGTRAQNITIIERGAIRQGSHNGTLRTSKVGKGFGFIERDDGQGELFCHASQLQNGGRDDMIAGSRMTFDISIDDQNGTTTAQNVWITKYGSIKEGAQSGTLVMFREGKGFGFIRCDNGQGDLFCHFASLTNGGHDDMIVGSRMTFDVSVDEQSGIQSAQNIMITKRGNLLDDTSCKACNAVFVVSPDASMCHRRGGDGWWYCHDCWGQWWKDEEESVGSSPSLRCVFPRWCPPSQDPVNINFPLQSSLPIHDVCSISQGIVVDAKNITDAVSIFYENGFVVLRHALTPSAAKDVLQVCKSIHAAVGDIDKECMGNRSRGRYSFGGVVATGQCFHFDAFSKHLVDNAAILDVIDAIYAEADRRRLSKSSTGHANSAADAAASAPATIPREPDELHKNPYYIVGTGGDFCEGWVREYQQLHSDYGRARPFGGPPWGIEGEPPVHDKGYPAQISVNFAVQELHRWNGATRVIPWREMENFVKEHGKHSAYKSGHSSMDGDIEVPPSLAHEFKFRRHWLASRIFPLRPGDALLRDVRVWHGGCPNLSRQPRYLPSLEVASKELVSHFASYRTPFPKRLLPAEYAQRMSERCRCRCEKVIMDEQCDLSSLKAHLNDFGWLKSVIAEPARRHEFLSESSLAPCQIEAISLRACLELIQQHGLDEDQDQWLMACLARLSVCDNTCGEQEVITQPQQFNLLMDVQELAHSLCGALAKGPQRQVFSDASPADTGGTLSLLLVNNRTSREHELVSVAQNRDCSDESKIMQTDGGDNRKEIASLACRLHGRLRRLKATCQDEPVRRVKQRVE